MRALAYVTTVVVFAGLAALVFWILAARPRRPVWDRIAGVLQLVAAYTFVVGILTHSGIFKTFPSIQDGLASPDPLKFVSANFYMMSILDSGMLLAFDPRTTLPLVRHLLTVWLLGNGLLLLLAYQAFHMLVVVPTTYFVYLLTSLPVDAILNASTDVRIAVSGPSGEINAATIKEMVGQHQTAIRHYAAGLPAFAASLAFRIWPLLQRRERQAR